MDLQAGARAAAAVLAHVLGVEGDPAELADALALLSDEPPVAAWAVELAADGDGVAFLLYAYDLAATDADGAAGRARLDRDLAVIAEATERGAPGPRVVAQADVGDWAIVVATSPATLQRLAADPDAQPAMPQEPVEYSGEPATPRERARAANALLAALRNADQRSLAYLRALGSGEADPTPEERALALFIADGRSLANLPRALARAVERVTAQADGSPT